MKSERRITRIRKQKEKFEKLNREVSLYHRFAQEVSTYLLFAVKASGENLTIDFQREENQHIAKTEQVWIKRDKENNRIHLIIHKIQ